MFCHYSMFCYSKGLITMTKKVEDAFITTGRKQERDLAAISMVSATKKCK